MQIPEPYNRSSTATAANWAHDDAPAEGFICPDCRRKFHTADGLVAHFESEHRGRSAASSAEFERHADGDPEFLGRGEGTDDTSSTTVGGSSVASGDLRAQLFSGKDFRRGSPPSEIEVERESDGGGGSRVIAEQRAVMDAQDAYLDGVGRAVTELGFLGRNIGASIARQGDALERVVEKTEGSNDRAAFVTRKAARQAQRAKPKKPIFVMSVALQVKKKKRMGINPLERTESACVCILRKMRQRERVAATFFVLLELTLTTAESILPSSTTDVCHTFLECTRLRR